MISPALALNLDPHALDLGSDELDIRHPQPSFNKKGCSKNRKRT
jgi:hypothetical protein